MTSTLNLKLIESARLRNRTTTSLKGEPMRMRVRKNRWYSAVWFKGQQIEVSLDAYKHETTRAQINLGKLLEQIERGIDPRANKKKVSGLVPLYLEELNKRSADVQERNVCILKNHIVPFFGDMKVGQVKGETIYNYQAVREKNGITESTLKKELRVVKDLIQTVKSDWKLPVLKYAHRGTTEWEALTLDQVFYVADMVPATSHDYGEVYKKIYLILAFTGLRLKSVVNLKSSQVDRRGGWVNIKVQSKTKNRVRIPICGKLEEVFRSIPVWPINQDANIFQVPCEKAVATAISRAFKLAGIKGSAKSLRHFFSSFLFNSGESREVIAKAIGHAPGSRCTDVYLHADDAVLERAVKAFDKPESILRMGGEKDV